jgi:uncharacterized protein (DUF2235 family)
MPKNILIYSDGTGQIGGLRPDQRLSNIYKMYRATRPGPDSPIKPDKQVAFYDPGLGVGEVGGITFRRIRNALQASLGTGIDENVIDCYEAIIANYNPGDRVCVFGFSRGAYTARSVANVMNLCGVPTKMSDGSPIPRYGPTLRKIASDAVKYVYNHGAGLNRRKYEDEREEKARRFRLKYGSNAEGAKANEQGNVQPTFVGVFDTVAALSNKIINWVVYASLGLLGVSSLFFYFYSWKWCMLVSFILIAIVGYWLLVICKSQFKYFSQNPNKPLQFSNPCDWPSIWKHGHYSVWSGKNYDEFLDPDVLYARHAMAIDELRKDFPRVKWGSLDDAKKTMDRKPTWLKQVWFAGCHSDIGGSYPEPESRLSDIALQWMMEELKECVPEIQVRDELLVTSPDPNGLQHAETNLIECGPLKIKWPYGPREINDAPLHPTVIERLKADAVPQLGEVKTYRPDNLAKHSKAQEFYKQIT